MRASPVGHPRGWNYGTVLLRCCIISTQNKMTDFGLAISGINAMAHVKLVPEFLESSYNTVIPKVTRIQAVISLATPTFWLYGLLFRIRLV
jgi:hypothetical protein